MRAELKRYHKAKADLSRMYILIISSPSRDPREREPRSPDSQKYGDNVPKYVRSGDVGFRSSHVAKRDRLTRREVPGERVQPLHRASGCVARGAAKPQYLQASISDFLGASTEASGVLVA